MLLHQGLNLKPPDVRPEQSLKDWRSLSDRNVTVRRAANCAMNDLTGPVIALMGVAENRIIIE